MDAVVCPSTSTCIFRTAKDISDDYCEDTAQAPGKSYCSSFQTGYSVTSKDIVTNGPLAQVQAPGTSYTSVVTCQDT